MMARKLQAGSTFLSVVARDRMILASPRKVNLVAKMVRGMKAAKALDALAFCKKAVARDVRKTLQAALANAESTYGLNVDLLSVREAYVGKSVSLRRSMARAKGSGALIRKKFSRLTIVVSEAGD
jgi:large subunit ribosomal protein L22